MITQMEINSYKCGLSLEELEMGQLVMDATADFHINEVVEIQKQYPGISEDGALDVSYLRTRSRHTEDLEKRLVREHLEGKLVNIFDWPGHSDEGRPAFE